MKSLTRFTLLLSFALAAFAQVTPGPVDCYQQFYFTTGNGTSTFDNRSIGCDQWTVVYQADPNLTGYTLAFESATGINAAGTFGAYAGNTINQSASFGTAANGLATYCSIASCASMGLTVNTPWVQINVSGATGTGAVRGAFYGYRTGYTGGTGGAGGGGSGGTGCPNPCPVEGVDAAGAAPTVPPVATAGFDGTDNHRVITDSTGRQVMVGGAASGASQVPANRRRIVRQRPASGNGIGGQPGNQHRQIGLRPRPHCEHHQHLCRAVRGHGFNGHGNSARAGVLLERQQYKPDLCDCQHHRSKHQCHMDELITAY